MHVDDERAMWSMASPGSDEDLESRLAMASPSDAARGMFLNSTVEAVRALGDEELVRRCLEVGGEEKVVDFFVYPIATNLRMVFAAARMLEEKYGSLDAAMRQLGRLAARSFLSSTAGLALQMLSRGDAKRLVGNLPSTYRATVSFGVRSVVWTGATSGRVTMRREFMPYPFHEGLLLGLLEKSQARNVQVRGHQLSTLESDYDICWTA